MNTRRNTEGDEKLETIVLEKPDEYDLLIRSVTVGWYGNLMGGLWLKQVSTEEYQKISDNPLQDYIKFGVAGVLYVEIERYPIYRKGDYTITSSTPEEDILTKFAGGITKEYKEKIMETYDLMMEELYNGEIEPERIPSSY